MSLQNKIKSAGIWQTLQSIIKIVSQFAYMAVMARLLTKDDFGLMALANSLIGFGILFSEAGMGSALIQRKDISQKHMNAALQSSIIIGFSVFALFFFSAPHIASFFNQPELEPIIKVIGIIIVLNSLSSVSRSLLQKNFKFKSTSLVSMLTTLLGYGAGIILAFKGWGVWSLVVANLTKYISNTVLLLYLAPVKLSLKIYFEEWKELFSFGAGMILARTINMLTNNGLNLVLGKILTPAKLGLFERSNSISRLPSGYMGDILDTIMFPAMAQVQNDKQRLFRLYQLSLGVVNTILIPAAFYLIFFSKDIVLILLGNQWLDAVLPLQILFIMLPFSVSVKMADSVIRAKGYIYKNVIRRGIHLTILLITAAFGAQYYGIIGASIAVTISFIINYLIMLLFVRKMFKKGITEIFLSPIMSGLKLSLIIMIPTVIVFFILQFANISSLLNFILTSVIIGIYIFLLAKKWPVIMGSYLQEIYNKFLSSKKKKQL